MNDLGWIFGLCALFIALIVIIFDRKQTKRTMQRIERMIEEVQQGSLIEKSFDESRLSALETRFADYLRASCVSAGNLCAEKDRIKTMIADISHQTKTPIANLLLYTELLQEEELPQSAKSSVEALHLQAEKLRFLIDTLIKLSRLENGIITLSPHPQKVQPLLQAAAKQFAPRAQQKGLFLQVEHTECSADFDLKWTGEALCNLVDNAIKYTQSGGITVKAVEYELFVRIDVSDTGCGIAESDQAKIFSRFCRLENAREQEGVGIGLYLSREIVSQEGGYIKVTSSGREGSVFSIFLPRC